MSQDRSIASDHHLSDGQRRGGAHTDIARIQEHVVALLAQLERPPRTLRVEAGEVSVDITWPEPVSSNGDSAQSPSSPGALAGEQPDEAAQAAAATDGCLVSPAVGVFYHAPQPGAEPFVSVGSSIRPGQQIGIVEAMKLMIPIEADRAGQITAVLKGNGEPVEYGEPLFALDVTGSPGGNDV